MRIAITVGPSAVRAVLKAALISSVVLAATPAQPNALAVATISILVDQVRHIGGFFKYRKLFENCVLVVAGDDVDEL